MIYCGRRNEACRITLAIPRPRARKKKFVIAPEHDGQRMALNAFDQCPVKVHV